LGKFDAFIDPVHVSPIQGFFLAQVVVNGLPETLKKESVVLQVRWLLCFALAGLECGIDVFVSRFPAARR